MISKFKVSLFSFLILLSISAVSQPTREKNTSKLFEKLEAIPGVVSIEEMKTSKPFSEKYVLMFKQLLDAENPDAGYFNQRVFISHSDFAEPVVFATEGYGADYAGGRFYVNELVRIFNTNQIVAEHRYFSKSIPEPINWKYLTIENAAYDHHILIQKLKTIYKEKWISTGISKGGQTCLIHRSLYPQDVDITIPYVAPLNFGVEDGRHELFIDAVSTKSDRNRILNYQKTVLKKRDRLFPVFKEYCDRYKYTFMIPFEEVYDYCVLEYSFAFWQWGHKISSIPENNTKDITLINHLFRVSSPSYFAIEKIEATKAFFVQAQHQLGYYGYDTKPFEGLLKIKTSKDYLKKIFLHEDAVMKYDEKAMKKVQLFLDTEDVNMIFIYGEFDPWSAPAVEFKDKKNMFKIILKGASHTARLSNLTIKQSKFVKEKIKEWLNNNK